MGAPFPGSQGFPTDAKQVTRNHVQREPGPESVLGPSWGRFWALLGHFWDPRSVEKASWNLRRFLPQKRVQQKTWLSWNGKRVHCESVKHCKRSKSSESSKNGKRGIGSTTRNSKARAARAARASTQQASSITWGPCSRAARARRAFGAGTFRESLERFCSELSGSITGKAEKTCCARSPGVWS